MTIHKEFGLPVHYKNEILGVFLNSNKIIKIQTTKRQIDLDQTIETNTNQICL